MASVSTYLKFANLQMAAEADLPVGFTGSIPKALLTEGNHRSSKFTNVLADQFIADGWVVEIHQANTSTGFSGTLFRNQQTGELVLSFRSTEFIDDAARDNQATNDLEILKGGWAIGQIADMEKWFAQLNASPALLQGKSFSVTGYSLGGHLATAFNILHEFEGQRILGTYTFNGAGVGRVNSNESLRVIVDRFEAARTNASAAFTSPGALAIYNHCNVARQADVHRALATSRSTNSVDTRATLRLRSSAIVCSARLCSSSLVLTSAIQAAVSTSTVGIGQPFWNAIEVVIVLLSEVRNSGVDCAVG